MGLEERSLAQTGPPPERPHARADWSRCWASGSSHRSWGSPSACSSTGSRSPPRTEAKQIDTLWDVLIIASVPVFVGVAIVVMFSALKFRMRQGEEDLDGPPIHGNTRLEVIWTAIPAILLVGLCTYAFIVLEDVEKAQANTMEVRVVGEQFAWTFFYANADGGKQVRLDGAAPAGEPAGQVHAPVQGRAARLLGPGVPHEEGRGAGHRRDLPRHAEPRGPLPDRLRRAVRPRPRHDARHRRRGVRGDVRRVPRRRPRTRPRPRRPPAARRRTASSSSRPTAAAATRWPTPAPPARPARSSTRSSRAWTWPRSGPSIADPGAEIVDGFSNIMPGDYEQKLRRCRRGCAGGVPFGSDQGGLMTARLRAPGLPRAGVFLVLGTLFCAAIIVAVREAYGYPVFADGGLTTKRPERDPAALAADRAAVVPRRPRRVRLLVLLGGGQADDPRGGPLRPRRARAGATTSGSTPITR